MCSFTSDNIIGIKFNDTIKKYYRVVHRKLFSVITSDKNKPLKMIHNNVHI